MARTPVDPKSETVETAALRHWHSSLRERRGPDMVANKPDLDLSSEEFDDFFDNSGGSLSRHFWGLALQARHSDSFNDRHTAYAELANILPLEDCATFEECKVSIRARQMVAAAPFAIKSSWG